MTRIAFPRGAGLLALILTAFTAPFAGAAPDGEVSSVVKLVPEEDAGWTPRNLFAPLRAGHYYAERSILVESSPPGAAIDLFYVRSGFQLRYEQADAPVRVVLPKRIEGTGRDSITIRAFLEGYREQEVTVRLASEEDHVVFNLDPLPNLLESVSHTYFAGRASLAFLTREALAFRLQEAREGFSVILAETAGSPAAKAALDGVRSPVVRGIQAQQLGEDLMVRVQLTSDNGSRPVVRSRQTHDPVRRLHSYAIDLTAPDAPDAWVVKAHSALERMQPVAPGCAIAFDERLRAGLDASELARALTPGGRFTDRYLRAAMRRHGELAPDGVMLLDGTRFRTSSPLELSAAMAQAHLVRGYLAFLRGFVAKLEPPEYRQETLRSLVAPESSPGAFSEIYEAALADERQCRAATGA